MITHDHVLICMRSAVGGVSKTQITRNLIEEHGLTKEDVEHVFRLCSFNSKPRKIDYSQFNNILITKIADKIKYPFTQIYTIENFLSEDQCNSLIEEIDKNLRPSTISDPEDSCITSDYRTSKTADLHYFDDPFYMSIDNQIASAMGLSPYLGEVMQGQRYETGQYYKEHWDFFAPMNKECKVYCEWMGQRTWTSMIYLNDVSVGGETYFKHLKLKFKPRKGTLVAWNNLYKNGIPNFKTMHEALPPINGTKYIITKWWRSWSLI